MPYRILGQGPNSHQIQKVTESDKATVHIKKGIWELAKQSQKQQVADSDKHCTHLLGICHF